MQPIEPKLLPLVPVNASASVLLVDDEEYNRALLRDHLAALGCRTSEAENGRQALDAVAARPPDLILLDVMMPGMDGFEVCRRLKQQTSTAPIPIIIVTALSERKERLMGIQAGANDFLIKPVDLQDLSLRVGNALYTKNLYDQLKAEQQKSERLLLGILPPSIVQRMKTGETTIADSHPEATVLVADLVGFTTLVAYISASQVVFLLNEIFCAFDLLVQQLDLEKIKTVGDSYIVAGGVNSTRKHHTRAMAELAIRMQDSVRSFNTQYNTSICIRVGIGTGPLVSGVIGRTKLAYDIWGGVVNLACQIQAAGPPGSIQVDEATYEKLKAAYPFAEARPVGLKNHSVVFVRTLITSSQPVGNPLPPPRCPSNVEILQAPR
jgi:CheY-like chemotaxis protein